MSGSVTPIGGEAPPVRRLVVVSAGLRVPSTTRLLADQLAAAASVALAAQREEPQGGALPGGEFLAGAPQGEASAGEAREAYTRSVMPLSVTTIEVRDHAHAIMDALLSGFATGELRGALDEVIAADALVLVAPTYQASYSGLFKSFMDLIEEGQLRGKPVLLAATGGTERHSLAVEYALRPLVAHLGAIAVPTGVFAATGDLGGATAPALGARIERAAGELAAMVGGGQVVAPARDEFADPIPFAEYLARLDPKSR